MAETQLRDNRGRFGPKLRQPETFNDWLLEIKDRRGFKYDYELSRLLNIPAENISRLFSGKGAPTAAHLCFIFKALNITPGSPDYNLVLHLAYLARLDMEQKQRRVNHRAKLQAV